VYISFASKSQQIVWTTPFVRGSNPTHPTNERAINQNVGSNKKAGSRMKKAGSQLTENQDEESRLFRG